MLPLSGIDQVKSCYMVLVCLNQLSEFSEEKHFRFLLAFSIDYCNLSSSTKELQLQNHVTELAYCLSVQSLEDNY